MEGRGGNRKEEKAAHAEKASPSLLDPPQDPFKGFGAKMSIIFFGKKGNSLQKFAGYHGNQENLQAVYTPAML